VLVVPLELLALLFSWWPSLGRFTEEKLFVNAISGNVRSHAHVTRKWVENSRGLTPGTWLIPSLVLCVKFQNSVRTAARRYSVNSSGSLKPEDAHRAFLILVGLSSTYYHLIDMKKHTYDQS
jgi:hypothetical protein